MIPHAERWYNRTVALIQAMLARHPEGIVKKHDEAPPWLRFLMLRVLRLAPLAPWIVPWGVAYLPSPVHSSTYHYLLLAWVAATWDVWRYGRSLVTLYPSPRKETLRSLSWVGRIFRTFLFVFFPLPFLWARYRERVVVACYVRPWMTLHLIMSGDNPTDVLKEDVIAHLASWRTGWCCTRWRAEEVFAHVWEEIKQSRDAGQLQHLLDT